MTFIFEKLQGSFFAGVVKKAVSLFKKSFFYSYLHTPSEIDLKYRTSFFKRLLDKPLFIINHLIYGLIAKSEKSIFIKKIKESRISAILKFEYLLSLFVLFMLITPHSMWNNLYAVIGAVFLTVLAFFSRVLKNKPITADNFSVWLIVFLIAVFVSIFITPSLLEGIRIALFIFSAAMFYFLIKEGICDKKALTVLIYSLTAALFVMCVYAVIQNFIGVETDAMLTDIANNKSMSGRVYSTVENPNNFAEIIVLIIPFIAAMFFSEKKKSKLSIAACFMICVAALLLSYSRGSYVSFAISAVVFIAFYRPKWLIPLLLAGIIMIPFLPESILNRILSIGSSSDTSNAYRIFLWEGVGRMIRYEGLYGTGLGPQAFYAAYEPYASVFALNANHSHMLYLQIFIETGFVGGIGFFAFIFSVIKKGFQALPSADNDIKLIIIAAISAFFGIAFSSATEYIWFYPRVMFVFFIVSGILSTSANLKGEVKNEELK